MYAYSLSLSLSLSLSHTHTHTHTHKCTHTQLYEATAARKGGQEDALETVTIVMGAKGMRM